jgi:hypothetical protein
MSTSAYDRLTSANARADAMQRRLTVAEAERDAALDVIAAVRKRVLQSQWIVCGELLRIIDGSPAAVPTEETG